MRWSTVLLVVLYFTLCEGLENAVEGRGKKKKIALAIYFADLVIKKIFILKLIYAFAFWVLLHKAGYIFGWVLSYFKEQKHEYHEYHGHHDHDHHHIEYGPPGPYRRKSQKPYNPYSSPVKTVPTYVMSK
ncbi:unnamed protein product [Chrysodeixis includens]|uniref:Uncharacterized protein n=1 Tax=Chrysodeixis includens TaxID=689277 RepID=A0A9P0BSS6_CHRIL|nr:unnamed protein product [Chrysodeixis includens]